MTRKVHLNEFKRHSSEVLDSAISEDFDSVVVVGYKDGSVHISSSNMEDIVKVVGAIEVAKAEVINSWL